MTAATITPITPAETYSLPGAVRAILTDTDLTDPGDVADQVAADIPDAELRFCLRLALRDYVRRVMSADRTHQASTTGNQAADDSQFSFVAGGGDPTRNVRAIREAWRTHLRTRYHIAGEWKMLATLTADDLNVAAQERAAAAAATQAWADRLIDWADLVQEHDVNCFGDLPDVVLADVLGGAR